MTDGQWIVISVLLLAWQSRRTNFGAGWVWPVPDISGGDAALISNGFTSAHLGSDIMYRDGAGVFYAPVGTPILAAHAGVVRLRGRGNRGWYVVIDDSVGPWATYYAHLDELAPWLVVGASVAAGQSIGVMGVDPMDAQGVRHLHFELWRDGQRSSAVDPSSVLQRARRESWTP